MAQQGTVTATVTIPLGPVFERLDKLDTRLDKLDTRLDKLDSRTERVEQLLDANAQLSGVLVQVLSHDTVAPRGSAARPLAALARCLEDLVTLACPATLGGRARRCGGAVR